MIEGITAILSSIEQSSKLYYEGREIFRTDNHPRNNYFHSWASIGRVSILVAKRIFYMTFENKVVSLLMDKAAIDRGDIIEVVYHKMDRLAHVWADDKELVCLNDIGNVEIVGYKSKNTNFVSSVDLSDHLLPELGCFAESKTEATTVTGCSQYLAVASHIERDKSNIVCLLDRRGRFQSKATDSENATFSRGPNNIHRMEFSFFEKRLFLVTQHLFNFVSLYVINPLKTAQIIYIRTILIGHCIVLWSLVSVPSKQGQLISSTDTKMNRILQIKLCHSSDT